jgi:hypothetical protein
MSPIAVMGGMNPEERSAPPEIRGVMRVFRQHAPKVSRLYVLCHRDSKSVL